MVLAALLLPMVAWGALSQEHSVQVARVTDDSVRTVYLRVGANAEGLLYEPVSREAKVRVPALILARPDGDSFGVLPAREMARRGYRVLAVNRHGERLR